MPMQRALSYVFLALVVLLQYPLWLGKGSWLRVWDVSRQVSLQKDKNQKLVARNAGLDAEVRDLKQGSEAVEGGLADNSFFTGAIGGFFE